MNDEYEPVSSHHLPFRQWTKWKKIWKYLESWQYEEYDSSKSQCYHFQMLLLSLPNDLHIKSCRFPIVNLPTGTGRTCTASSVSCGDQSGTEGEPEISLNITEQGWIIRSSTSEKLREIIFRKLLCHSSIDQSGALSLVGIHRDTLLWLEELEVYAITTHL